MSQNKLFITSPILSSESFAEKGSFESQRGFTLIELLISMGLIGILSAISVTAFAFYKKQAQITQADSDYRNARTASEVGYQERENEDLVIGLTYSATDGSALTGDLKTMLPGAVVTDGVRLGASVNTCLSSGGGAVAQQVIAESCKGQVYNSWLRNCDGTEVFMYNVDSPGC